MNPSLRLRGRHPLHPMNTAFIPQFAEYSFARYSEDRFLQSAELRGTRFQILRSQPSRLRITVIHAVKVSCENRRFIPAGTGADFYNGVTFFILICWEQGD